MNTCNAKNTDTTIKLAIKYSKTYKKFIIISIFALIILPLLIGVLIGIIIPRMSMHYQVDTAIGGLIGLIFSIFIFRKQFKTIRDIKSIQYEDNTIFYTLSDDTKFKINLANITKPIINNNHIFFNIRYKKKPQQDESKLTFFIIQNDQKCEELFNVIADKIKNSI